MADSVSFLIPFANDWSQIFFFKRVKLKKLTLFKMITSLYVLTKFLSLLRGIKTICSKRNYGKTWIYQLHIIYVFHLYDLRRACAVTGDIWWFWVYCDLIYENDTLKRKLLLMLLIILSDKTFVDFCGSMTCLYIMYNLFMLLVG